MLEGRTSILLRTLITVCLLFTTSIAQRSKDQEDNTRIYRSFLFTKAEKDAIKQLRDDGNIEEADRLMLSTMEAAYSEKRTEAAQNCTCACNNNLMPSLFENYGYGKYCGLGYGCQSLEEPGCDPIDDCCKIHDACVNSYCASCLCNIRLVRCLQGLNTTAGFEPCNSGQAARRAILDDICFVIKYAPSLCGGCNSLIPTPAACLVSTS